MTIHRIHEIGPSDYYLFPNLKRFLAGKRFTLNEEAIGVMDGYFVDKPEWLYNDGIELLENRWTKCIDVEGDYIEKFHAKNNCFFLLF